MGRALQLIAGSAAVTAGTTVQASASSPDANFNVPVFPTSAHGWLEQIWAKAATPGQFRIRSPRFHDANQGIRLQIGATAPYLGLPWGIDQPLFPGDSPIVEIIGAATETDTVYALYGFDNYPGLDVKYAMWSEVMPRITQITGVQVAPSTSATAGTWGNARAINADFDNYQAGAVYALLGFEVNTAVGAFAIMGPDTGNLKIGGPAPLDHIQTRDYFVRLSVESGRPYIPLIQANNKYNTNVFVHDAATGATIIVTLILAMITPGP